VEPACGIDWTAKHPRNLPLPFYLSLPPKKPKASKQSYIKASVNSPQALEKKIWNSVFGDEKKQGGSLQGFKNSQTKNFDLCFSRGYATALCCTDFC
jgi:hypothetical protein